MLKDAKIQSAKYRLWKVLQGKWFSFSNKLTELRRKKKKEDLLGDLRDINQCNFGTILKQSVWNTGWSLDNIQNWFPVGCDKEYYGSIHKLFMH